MRFLIAIAALIIQCGGALAESTINPTVPATSSQLTSAPVRANFNAAYTDINNLLSMFAGSSPPVSPSVGQYWRDTSTSPSTVRVWSGTAWVAFYMFNTVTNTISVVGGSGGLPLTGGTMTGRLVTSGVVGGLSGLNIPQGTPSAFVNGDIWTTSAGLFAYVNGSAQGPYLAGTTGTSGHTIPFLDGSNTWSSPQNMTALSITSSPSLVTSPTGNPTGGALLSTYSSLLVQTDTSQTSNREFVAQIGMRSNLGWGAANGNQDKVALYVGAQAGTNSSDIWAVNFLCELKADLVNNINNNCNETDLDNRHAHYLTLSPSVFGTIISGAGDHQSTAAFGATGISPAITVTGAANNGSGLIRLAVTSTSTLLTGFRTTVAGVVGTTEANGVWTLTVIDGTHVDLQRSTFSHAYASGGTMVGPIWRYGYALLNNTANEIGFYDFSNSKVAFGVDGAHDIGLDLSRVSFGIAPVLVANSSAISALASDNTTVVSMAYVDSSNIVQIGGNFPVNVNALTTTNTLRVHPATDKNLRITANSSLSDGVALTSNNDASSANKGMEFISSQFYFNGGTVLMPNNVALQMKQSGGAATNVLYVDGANVVQVGGGLGVNMSSTLGVSGAVVLGSTLTAAGTVQVPNNVAYQTKQTGGSAANILYLDTSNITQVGGGLPVAVASTLTVGNNVKFSVFGAGIAAFDASGNVSSRGTTGTAGNTVVLSASPTISALTVTGSFTATGLVTNADLANAATTVNGQTCTLGSTCTISASATGVTVGSTTISGGSNGNVLSISSGVLGSVSPTTTLGQTALTLGSTALDLTMTNNHIVGWRNAANSTTINALYLDASNVFQVGGGSNVSIAATGASAFSVSGSASFGPGGTGTTPNNITINGSSGASGGGEIYFSKNGSVQWAVGSASAVLGSSSNDFVFYTTGLSSVPLSLNYTTGAITSGLGGTGTVPAQISLNGGSGVGGGAGITFYSNSVARWAVGQQSAILGSGTSTNFIIYNGQVGNALTIDSTTNALTLTSSTASVSPSTGSFIAPGGAGIGGALNVGTYIGLGSTPSITTGTGLVAGITGGVGTVSVNPYVDTNNTTSGLVVQLVDQAGAATYGGTGYEYAAVFGIKSTHNTGSLGPNKVGVAGMADMSGSASGNGWGGYFLCGLETASRSGSICTGTEIDVINSQAIDRNYANLGSPSYGLQLTGTSDASNTAALLISGLAGAPQWYAGIVFNNFRSNVGSFTATFNGTTTMVVTAKPGGTDVRIGATISGTGVTAGTTIVSGPGGGGTGTYIISATATSGSGVTVSMSSAAYGIDFAFDASTSFSAAAIRLPNNQTITWKNSGGTNIGALYLDGSNVFQLGGGLPVNVSAAVSITGVLTMSSAILLPNNQAYAANQTGGTPTSILYIDTSNVTQVGGGLNVNVAATGASAFNVVGGLNAGSNNSSATIAKFNLKGGSLTSGGAQMTWGVGGADNWIVGHRSAIFGGSTSRNLVFYNGAAGAAVEIDYASNIVTMYAALNATLTSSAQTNVVCFNSGSGSMTYQTWATGCAVSSARYKNLDRKITGDEALACVSRLEAWRFKYKPEMDMGDEYHVSFLAEQVAKFCPEFVQSEKDGATPRAVKINEFPAVFAAAIGRLRADNDNMRIEIEKLRASR